LGIGAILASGRAAISGKSAEREGVPLNQLINVAGAEKVSALRTAEYFQKRGRRADRAETLRILERAGRGNPPAEGDELPTEGQKKRGSSDWARFGQQAGPKAETQETFAALMTVLEKPDYEEAACMNNRCGTRSIAGSAVDVVICAAAPPPRLDHSYRRFGIPGTTLWCCPAPALRLDSRSDQ